MRGAQRRKEMTLFQYDRLLLNTIIYFYIKSPSIKQEVHAKDDYIILPFRA